MANPISLPVGSDGAPGLNGGFGGYSLRYTFDNTAGTSAASGTLRLNNTNLAIATILAVSTSVASGIDISTVLTSLDTPCLIRIFSEFDETKFFYGKIDSSTVTQGVYNITPIQANGTIGAGESVVISFTPFIVAPILQAIVTIPNANVLALYTTQYQILPAPIDTTKAIEGYIASAELLYGGTVFAFGVGGNLELITDTATLPQFRWGTGFNNSTQNVRFVQPILAGNTTNGTQIIPGKALMAYISNSNWTTGNSDVKIRVDYKIQ